MYVVHHHATTSHSKNQNRHFFCSHHGIKVTQAARECNQCVLNGLIQKGKQMLEPHNHVVEVGDLRLNVFEWGSSDKPLLVLLHGLASSSHMFDLIAPKLAEDFHVIAYDQRGHGLSDKPDTGYDFETISSDLDNLLLAMGLANKEFVLAGHSWGGFTALYYAATRAARVRKAILIDGGLQRATDLFDSLEAMAPPQRANWSIADVKRMIHENWLGAAYRPELEPLVLSIYDQSNPNDVKPYLTLARHMQIARALWDFRAVDYFAKVQAPVLAVLGIGFGEAPDPRIKAYVNEAKAKLKHFDAAWMPETIHDIPWHRPQELVEIMRRFLAE